jgi:hypothetical protein
MATICDIAISLRHRQYRGVSAIRNSAICDIAATRHRGPLDRAQYDIAISLRQWGTVRPLSEDLLYAISLRQQGQQ